MAELGAFGSGLTVRLSDSCSLGSSCEIPSPPQAPKSRGPFGRGSNCLKHLETNNIKDVASFLKATASDLKAIGFLTEVRTKLQRAMKKESTPEDEAGAEEKFVTIEEEESALESNSKAGGKKKKRGGKSASKPLGLNGAPVPGESGVAMDPALANLLTTLGLGNYVPIFQNNNIISLSDCVRLTREALVGNFAVPDDKAGLLLAHIKNAMPGAAAGRPLPELGRDLSAVISVMRIAEQLRDQVRTSLQTNNVLSVQDAKDKRFALMNEVGLTADAATELGRCLDAGPGILPPAQQHPVDDYGNMGFGGGRGP
ncbi:hypothetical protein T484DRAFT_1776936, partial [Baffinella frigidus]